MNFVVFADSGAAAAARGLPPTFIQMDFSRYYCCSWFNLSPRSPGCVCLSSWHRGRSTPGLGGPAMGDAEVLGTEQVMGGAVPSVRGAGIPTAPAAARWPLRHPSWGHCHHRNATRAGWESCRMWQPPNPPGAGGTMPGSTQKPRVTPTHPPIPRSGQGSIPQPPSNPIWDPLESALPLAGGHRLRVPAVPGSVLQGSQILPGSFAAWGTDPKLEGLS